MQATTNDEQTVIHQQSTGSQNPLQTNNNPIESLQDNENLVNPQTITPLTTNNTRYN